MASQLFATTGDPRLKRRRQVEALNARLPMLPQILAEQRAAERFEHQKEVDEKSLAIRRQAARDQRKLGKRRLEQQERAERTAMGIKGFGAAMKLTDNSDPLFGAGGIFGGGEDRAQTASPLPGPYGAIDRVRSAGGTGLSNARWSPRTESGMGSIQPPTQPATSGLRGHFQGLKGAATTGNTLGSALTGFGAGSIFGEKNKWKGAAFGAGAGMLMNLFGGGGAPGGIYDDILSGISGGLGGMFSGLF